MSTPRVVIVTFADAQILDVTGPLEVFSSAARFLPSARYRTDVVTTTGPPVVVTTSVRYPADGRKREALENTSKGPVTSRIWASANVTMTTRGRLIRCPSPQRRPVPSWPGSSTTRPFPRAVTPAG